jgi:catechol 2,3-dioxygenase-like lactoylglutathione lyase family enzyme
MTRPAPPVLAVADVEGAASWWTDHLGFAVEFRNLRTDEPTNYAVVTRDDVEVHLARREEISDRRRSEIVVTVLDLDALAGELLDRSAGVHRLSTGDLVVRDPDGNRIVFTVDELQGSAGDGSGAPRYPRP